MTAVNFAALPPEVNSVRMYAGAGSGPLTVAAAAWDRLAAELTSAASSYRTIISELTDGPWLGPASVAMTAAVAPYVEWMDSTAVQAGQTASQARAAAGAYEAAFAATVPPPVIAANRASLASLVASNILGQNTHAIAANQAQYAEMWSQDATAMYGYQANSAAATTFRPFTPAPAAAQGNSILDKLNEFIVHLGDTLQKLGTSGLSAKVLDFLSSTPFQLLEAGSVFTTGFNAAQGGVSIVASGALLITAVPENAALAFTLWWVASQSAMGAAGGLLGTGSAMGGAGSMPAGVLGSTLVGSGSALGGSGLAGLGGAQASAGLGRAASVGGLSVPQSWGTGAPVAPVRLTATALPAAGSAALPETGAAAPRGMFGGMPMVGSVVNAPRNGDSRSRPRANVTARTPGERGARGETLNQWLQPSEGVSVLSERDELNKLRQAAVELAKKRDALTRSAAKMIKHARQQ